MLHASGSLPESFSGGYKKEEFGELLFKAISLT